MSDSDTMRYRHNRRRPARLTAEEEAWLDARSEAEIEAAAATDPDNPPLTAEQLAAPAASSRSPACGAARAHPGGVRAPLPAAARDGARLEQGRSIPDAPARALLHAIDGEPELLARVLGSDGTTSPKEAARPLTSHSRFGGSQPIFYSWLKERAGNSSTTTIYTLWYPMLRSRRPHTTRSPSGQITIWQCLFFSTFIMELSSF